MAPVAAVWSVECLGRLLACVTRHVVIGLLAMLLISAQRCHVHTTTNNNNNNTSSNNRQGMKGFVKGKKLKKMGMKAQDTSELFFEDLRVPASAILGEVNKGFYAVMQELPQERLLIADIAVSSGEAVYEWSRTCVVSIGTGGRRWQSVAGGGGGGGGGRGTVAMMAVVLEAAGDCWRRRWAVARWRRRAAVAAGDGGADGNGACGGGGGGVASQLM